MKTLVKNSFSSGSDQTWSGVFVDKAGEATSKKNLLLAGAVYAVITISH